MSKLTSSYAWDTAVNFIQIKNSDYGTSYQTVGFRITLFFNNTN